jgi:quercetin dioxygenase-like cupin family protein
LWEGFEKFKFPGYHAGIKEWGLTKMRILMLLLAMAAGTVYAHEENNSVVPDSERAIARDLKAEGPQANKGVSVTALGGVALAAELPNAGDRTLRAREIIIEPGGVVAVHQHEGRPGMAYILEGEVVEHRSDASAGIVRKAGAVSFEKTGLTHWWENKSDKKMRALVVDIIPEEAAQNKPASK